MVCSRCASGKVYQGTFCSSCFVDVIEMRLKKRLRGLLPKSGIPKLVVLDRVSQVAIGRVLKRPHDLVFLKGKDIKPPSGAIVLFPWCAEDSIDDFLAMLSTGKSSKSDKDTIRWWDSVLEDEVRAYAKAIGKHWTPQRKRTLINRWNSLTSKDPHLLFGMQKSARSFNKKGKN